MTMSISAVILAGGQAKRMEGADKGLQLLHGKPLFQFIYDRLHSQVETISINANRNQTIYATAGVPVFGDNLEGFQGPLSGILTALERADSDFVLFVPCDSPFFLSSEQVPHITPPPHQATVSKVRWIFTAFLLRMCMMVNVNILRFV